MDIQLAKKKSNAGACYIFDLSKIQIGDILLSTSDAWKSNLIRHVTRSSFSHAAIFVHHGGVLIEAVSLGVKLTSVLGRAVREKQSIKILRFRCESNETNMSQLGEIAKSHLYKKYALKGALLCTAPFDSYAPSTNELFCSQLIAESYAEYGFPLLDKAPHKVSPGDLLRSNRLLDVTDEILVEVERHDLSGLSYIEDGARDDLGGEFNKIINEVVGRTCSACSFIEVPLPKSLDNIRYILLFGGQKFSVSQLSMLELEFEKNLANRLELFLELLREVYDESFNAVRRVSSLIASGIATRQELELHRKMLSDAAEVHRHSISQRMQDMGKFNAWKVESKITRDISVIEKIDNFYIGLLESEKLLLESAIAGAQIISDYLELKLSDT